MKRKMYPVDTIVLQAVLNVLRDMVRAGATEIAAGLAMNVAPQKKCVPENTMDMDAPLLELSVRKVNVTNRLDGGGKAGAVLLMVAGEHRV